MDEFTSIFYVPAESYRFIGSSAIVFIALTSILIRFLSTRFVEIAEILEHHGLIGGGVYSFSYLVLGPDSVLCGDFVDHGGLHPHGLYFRS